MERSEHKSETEFTPPFGRNVLTKDPSPKGGVQFAQQLMFAKVP